MNINNPNLIRKLVACPETQIPNFAKQHNMKPSIATVIRDHWTRRVKGVCVRCGRRVEGDRCDNCGTVALSSLTLLEMLNPDTILVRVTCRSCKEPLNYLVKDVLRLVKRYGAFHPSTECPRCKREKAKRVKEAAAVPAPKAVKPLVPLKEKTPRNKKKEKRVPVVEYVSIPSAPPVAPVIKAETQPSPLTYRPFEALQGLKIEKRA